MLLFFNWVFGSLQTSLLCIMGELAGGGSLAVAVGVDRWHATHDTWHVKNDTWHMASDTWHLTPDMWHLTRDPWQIILFFSYFLSVTVSFGISATIRTHREIYCVRYAGFKLTLLHWTAPPLILIDLYKWSKQWNGLVSRDQCWMQLFSYKYSFTI